MKIKNYKLASIIAVLVLLFPGTNYESLALNSISDTSKVSFGLFEEDKPLEITLRLDLSTYFRTKPQEEYIKTNIILHLSKTDSINKNIKLRTRGAFRNQYCRFAPIELNFKKADFGFSDLNKISKIKLAPQCGSGKQNEDYLLREYLTYKLFNVLTDTSFRVRLLTVNYIDSEKKRKPIRQFAFFIEPVEMLTTRTNTVQIKTHTLTQKNIDPRVMDRFTLFNYMIGNYDWAVPNQHNVLIIKPLAFDPNSLPIAVPHDFDWTGLVNATYAIPAEIVGTENVRERIFTGICRSKEEYRKDLDMLLKKKDEFYRVINEFPYLNQSSKKDMINYLDGFFYQITGKNDNLIFYLMNSCKKL
jgi:hypothetical protein